MMIRVYLMLLVVFILVPTADAQVSFSVTAGEGDARDCIISVDPAMTLVVAWEEAGLIRSWGMSGDVNFAVETHAAGSMPELCATEYGFVLAWASDNAVVIRSGYGEYWSDMEIVTGSAEPISSLALTGWQPGVPFHEPYLCWEHQDGSIWFSRIEGGHWLPGQLVTILSGYGYMMPRVVPAETAQGVWPRIYYQNMGDMEYIDGVGYDWTGPTQNVFPGSSAFGVDFEACAGPGYSQHILSLGIPATCMCNVIHYSEWQPDTGWVGPEGMTVDVGFYNDPAYPSIGVDEDGRVNAFWYQAARDEMFNLVDESMYASLREAGVWSDVGSELEGHVGHDCDMAIDPMNDPAYVWIEDNGFNDEVWVLFTPHMGAAAQAPLAEIGLAAHPNPFNPQTKVSYHVDEAGQLRLSVHDMAGRRLCNLAVGHHEIGEHSRIWDGRDDSGNELPSGIYLLKLEGHSGRSESSKLALIR